MDNFPIRQWLLMWKGDVNQDTAWEGKSSLQGKIQEFSLGTRQSFHSRAMVEALRLDLHQNQSVLL